MKTWMFSWNGRKRFIDAETQREAENRFMERFGFWPDNVDITEVV